MSAAFIKQGIQQIYVSRRVGRPVQRSTGTSSLAVASKMKTMVKELKRDREWDLLDAVTAAPPRLTLKELYDAKQSRTLAELRERLKAIDLEPLVTPWIEAKRAELGGTGTPDLFLAQVRTLIPADIPFSSADLTPAKVSGWLTGLTVSSGTRRHYYTAIASFINYAIGMGALTKSPLVEGRIKRPKKNPARERWLYEADAIRIVEASTGIYRVLEALVQGTGAEIGSIVKWARNPTGLLRRDFDLERGTVHLRGTKASTRSRVAIIRPWALPIIAEHVRTLLPNAEVFPGETRHTMHRHHDRTCAAIGIDDYTVHDARHTWAVNARFRGIDLEDIAEQLGHKGIGSTMIYAKFKPTLEQRQEREAK